MKILLVSLFLFCFIGAHGQNVSFYNYTISGALAADYQYRRTITIDNSGNTQSLTNQQIEFNLTSSNFDFSRVKSDGGDIHAKETNGTSLDFWLESFNKLAQTATIWVKIPSVSAGGTSSFHLYYGNATQTTLSNKAATMETWTVTGDATHVFTQGSYSGVLNTYPSSGAITCRFTPTGSFQNTRIFAKVNTASAHDFIDLYINASNNLVLRVSKSNVLKTVTGRTTIVSGVEYAVTFSWNQMWKLLYVDGVIDANLFCDTPTNGSQAPFTSGSLDTGSGATSVFPGTITGGVIHNTQKQRQHVRALHEERKFYYKDEESKWVKIQAPRFSPGGNPVFEPSVIVETDTIKMWYSKMDGTNRTSIYYGYTVNMASGFTEVQRVLGEGAGGESWDVARSSVYKEGSTYYMYYIPYNGAANIGVPNSIYVATSTNGKIWSGNTMVLNKSASPGFQNTSVLKIGSTYHMYYDIDDGGGDEIGRYTVGHATSSSPTGTFTADGANPLQSIQYGAVGTTYGAAFGLLYGSTLQLWFLATPPEKPIGILPSEIYRSYSTDFTNFTHAYTTSTIAIDMYPDEFDQVSDPVVFEKAGESWMSSADNDNGLGNFNGNTTFKGVLNFHRYPGTLTQLITDVTYTISSETQL